MVVEAAERATAARRRRAAERPPDDLSRRVVIENVTPEVDGGRFPARRAVGEKVVVEADIFADGPDAVSCVLLYRREGDAAWTEVPMEHLGNDRWRAAFAVSELTACRYTLEAWIDPFQTWRSDLIKRLDAGQKPAVELQIGAALVEEAAARASGRDAERLRESAVRLAAGERPAQQARLALGERLAALMAKHPDRRRATRYQREMEVRVDPAKAAFSAWYEMFPRSIWRPAGQGPSHRLSERRHGAFKDCEARLPYVAGMGFDVLYLPPVHPIGRTHRKGKNNATEAAAGEPGSPWAIGSPEGGHKSVHPELGTLEDFRRLVRKAEEYGIDVALDIAFQCSPDHPYVTEHPEWFRRRPDGSLQYAENPPKKYEDIYPFNFDTQNRRELWEELKSIVTFWIEHGVRIFRVDNPHTKPFSFWEWLISEIKRDHPDVILLSEAFTRPKVMYRLAKLGFTQSYTYFAWRNTKSELTEYLTELTQTGVRDFFRPSFWPNTPDILTEYMQTGGRSAFMARLALAATLSANYGIYGPAFELGERTPREPHSEEYLDSEKYEIKHWDIEAPDSLREFIARVNRIRRDNPALHSNWGLRFHHVDNDHLVCHSKQTDDLRNIVITVVNLDCAHTQSGWVDLPLADWGIGPAEPYQAHDLLSDTRYTWTGPRNFVRLDPHVAPAHIFRLRRPAGAGREVG